MAADPRELEEEALRVAKEGAPSSRRGDGGLAPASAPPLALGAGELGAGELGAGELGAGELGAGELGAGELGAGELGAAGRPAGAGASTDSENQETQLMAGRERPSLGSGVFEYAAPPSSRRPLSRDIILPIVEPGSYAIAGEFARGGLGRILRARDLRLGRPVALKILLESGTEVERRFVREAVVTARLQHPGIVPIYEAGRFTDGTPFYAMRLVSGGPLSNVLRRARTIDARLALIPHLIRAAEAIAYAHSRRIIHRDIKPENILVGEFGETVVIDWGFAKNLAADGAPEDTLQWGVTETITRAGAILGTPSYMAPEQARGRPVDERVDVYALGAILYRLLAGRRPYDEVHPARVLKRLSEGPPPPLADRAPGAPPELVAIAVKAMARKPADRYRSARELADDLRRFQTGQLVAAHRYTQGQLFGRWIRRHAVASVVGAVALVVLLVVGVTAIRGVIAARDGAERRSREAAAAEADAQRAVIAARAAQLEAFSRADELTLLQARAVVEQDPTLAVAWLKRLSLDWARWDLVRPVALAAQRLGIADVLRGHQGDVTALAFSTDGARLASGSADKSVRVWELSTSQSALLTGSTAEITAVAFSPDGAMVAAASRDGAVRIWTLATGAVRALSGHDTTARALAFSPDGSRLSVGGGGGGVEIWDLSLGTSEVFATHRGAVRVVAYMAEGRVVASAGEDGAVMLRDLGTQRSRLQARQPGAIAAMACSADGKRLAYAGEYGPIHVLALDGGPGRVLGWHQDKISSLSFSADGRNLVSAGAGRSAQLWDMATGSSRALLGGEDTLAAVMSPDGSRIARAGADRLVFVFQAAADTRPIPSGAGLRDWLAASTRAEVDAAGKLTAAPP